MEDLPNCLTPLSSSSSSSEPDPFSTVSDLWLMAEQRVHEVMCTVRPNIVVDNRRTEIIDYIKRIFRFCGFEVFPFGSVPLKTYLPDGDIDLTALCLPNVEEDLASNICHILKGEECSSEYQVKDVHYIHAQGIKVPSLINYRPILPSHTDQECVASILGGRGRDSNPAPQPQVQVLDQFGKQALVEVVKCKIQNIPVDISFNQTAGLCALSFLEQVDHIIGKGHLFKRSIILIKSWCFYESRIIGAHHGLISTYALEILVLYIFNRFHSSLSGPLGVLHKFLDFYSVFDWETYCVTINGPIAISSLSGNMETPVYDGNDLLFSKELVEHWRHILPVPTTRGREFHVKHLNIVDPLNNNNNLGRSVSRGNLHRIKCALTYGAAQLNQIVSLPGESLGDRVEKYFANTLDRNGRGQRPDLMLPVPAFGIGRTFTSNLSGDYDSYCSIMLYGQWYRSFTSEVPMQAAITPSPWQVPTWNALTFMEWMASSNRWNLPPQLSIEPFVRIPQVYHQNAPQLASVNLTDVRRSRGTGTYIPVPRRNENGFPNRPGSSHRGGLGGVPPRFRYRNREFRFQQSPASPRNSYDRVDAHAKTDERSNTSGLAEIPLEALSLQEIDTHWPVPSGLQQRTSSASPSGLGTSIRSPSRATSNPPEANDASASSSTHTVRTQKREDLKGSRAKHGNDSHETPP